ncbi:hypothetical protein QVD17_39398 [Tagetes erecta]|uniref:Uncharacterized protein n=1 Tax=Tagetes erecta TaxID=13708 RepID=A0AAD8JSA3_TARER|nr:hypothetical protein QVD17_39398 [Tagetes erecta]
MIFGYMIENIQSSRKDKWLLYSRKVKASAAGLDEDVIRGLNTSLANELSIVKTKLMNLEKRERHYETEMEDLRKIVLDQHCLIKKLLSDLNEVKKETKVGTTETEAEINKMIIGPNTASPIGIRAFGSHLNPVHHKRTLFDKKSAPD